MKGSKGKAAVRVPKEALNPVDDRRVGKRKVAATKVNYRKAKTQKKAKNDPNKPKRPPSAFFVFLKIFKKENPNVGKAAEEKWKSMSPAEKAPFKSKAGKLKAEYGKQMNAYNKKQESNDSGEASDRSKSEVNDEDEETSGEEEQKQSQEQEQKREQDEEEEEEDEDDA